jgi:hypothetical protein
MPSLPYIVLVCGYYRGPLVRRFNTLQNAEAFAEGWCESGAWSMSATPWGFAVVEVA